MEPNRGNELKRETKALSDGCEEAARGIEAQQSEREPPSECTDASPSTPQAPCKLKKTTFKLFGGRRSICALPSFFGGRNKGHGKGSAKKGLMKSKTHDCITKVSWEDARSSGDVLAGDFEYHNQNGLVEKRLCNSQSSNIDIVEFAKGESSCLRTLLTEDHKHTLDKSLSFPHPKKGLKGLFSSIRRHKKNKSIKMDKGDMDISKDVPVKFDPHGVKSQSLEESKVPAPDTDRCDECEGEMIALVEDIPQDNSESLTSLKAQVLIGSDGTEIAVVNAERTSLCASSITHIPDVNPESAEEDRPSLHSSDKITLIFGDVSSLKSFDSLTGCGDIIADQDDDSVADSGVSAERGRNAGKRSSCYVTYQGGGEEMATPNEVDGEYIQELWEKEAAVDIYVPSQQPDFIEPSKSLELTPESSDIHSYPDGDSCSTFPHAVPDNDLIPEDVLTPQSEHQESVPNSDEGYYDSTTPGADEEGVDGVCTLGPDRLPRDSYSGDALYELFEPDDSLMSPPLREGSSFETQKLPSNTLEFLNINLHGCDKDVHTSFTSDSGVTETEETRLAKIQHKLLCSDLQSLQKPLRECSVMGTGRLCAEDEPGECLLQRQHYTCLQEELSILHLSSSKAKSQFHGSQSLKTNNQVVGGSSQKLHDKLLPVVAADESGSRVPQSQHQLQDSGLYADKNDQRPSQRKNQVQNYCMDNKVDVEHDQTICFSQALVDFTKHAQLFNDLSKNIGGSESSSPFAQNMQVLPSMVTFDVVDMENEGEYDEQVEMVADDIASPFKDYCEAYLQKDYAACDTHLLNFSDQILFLGNICGVSSLPRHLSLTKVNRAMPAPLSLNRRSKSLDTDSLDCEMSESYLTQSRVNPSLNPIPKIEMDHKTAFFMNSKRKGNYGNPQIKNNTNSVPSCQPETPGTLILPSTDGRRVCQMGPISPQQEKVKLMCGSSGRSEMQPEGHSTSWKSQPQIGCSSERTEAYFLNNDNSALDSVHQCAKMKPVGLTQGVSHLCSDVADISNSAVHKEAKDFAFKSRQAVDMVLSTGLHKNT